MSTILIREVAVFPHRPPNHQPPARAVALPCQPLGCQSKVPLNTEENAATIALLQMKPSRDAQVYVWVAAVCKALINGKRSL